jgi:hypothetical protein
LGRFNITIGIVCAAFDVAKGDGDNQGSVFVDASLAMGGVFTWLRDPSCGKLEGAPTDTSPRGDSLGAALKIDTADSPVSECANPAKIPAMRIAEADFGRLSEELFSRYDFDNSGTLNDPAELSQLTLNMLYKLSENSGTTRAESLKVDAVERGCAAVPVLSDENSWSKEEYTKWFVATFRIQFVKLD